MHKQIRWAIVASFLSLLLISPPRVLGWGNTGHEAVAYIAWQQMTPAARTRAIELIKLVPTLHNADNTKSIPGYAEWVAELPAGLSQDDQNLYLFMRAATWPDTIKHEWFKDSDTPPKGVTTDVNLGFTDTASHGYWHFIDTGFASDTSTVPPTPIPNVATEIVALRAFIGSNEDDLLKSYDLVWLEHLVGDVHQPLHGSARYFAGKSDAGGNDVPVKLTTAMNKAFEGTLSKSAPDELHAFWDDLPGEGQPGPALPQAAAFGKSLAQAAKTKVAVTDPAKWAAESLAMAKKDAYAPPIGSSPTPPAPAKSYVITTVYYNKAMKDAKSRVALAGARLAKLLNENLK
jgi:hypothetical protein